MLSLDQARAIIAAARARGRELALKPLTVVVLDAGGHMVAMEREDGAAYGRPQIAGAKLPAPSPWVCPVVHWATWRPSARSSSRR
jgi:uncharacterized protein GlcG (DUF336 family)